MPNNVTENANFFAYFGDAFDQLPHSDTGRLTEFNLLGEKIKRVFNQTRLSLFFLKQTHSSDVVVLRHTIEKNIFFQKKGDAIITHKKNVGIGVITADCVPLFLFDPKNNVIGVVHAGWKGLSQKIITATLLAMQKNFDTDLTQLTVYIGPAAGICCYEVQKDFLKYFPKNIFEKKIARYRNEKIFFDSKTMAMTELLENNVSRKNINIDHHVCTICNPQYCSFRREKDKAGRQASLIMLRS